MLTYSNLSNLLRKSPKIHQSIWKMRTSIRALERALIVGKPVINGNGILHQAIIDRKPFAAGKMGSVEANSLSTWRMRQKAKYTGQLPPAYSKYVIQTLYVNAGVFPNEPEIFDKFGAVYLDAVSKCDAVVAWDVAGEARILADHCRAANLIKLRSLEPYFFDQPWSSALAGRKVLIISPFVHSIKNQYEQRSMLWANQEILPEFKLLTIRAPLSAAITEPESSDWFEALDLMKSGMDAFEYDVLLVGAGAFSLPLASHAKLRGKVGIHMGGALQILFGIIGQRWRERNDFKPFINKFWTSPSKEETPNECKIIEGGCYW